jgi:circadian clock protein KaiB
MRPLDPSPPANGVDKGEIILRLYITGVAPNSIRAVENLKALCEVHFPERWRLEIVDVLREPLRALSDDILVTPTLVRLAPGARTSVIGDLSDERRVLSALSAA